MQPFDFELNLEGIDSQIASQLAQVNGAVRSPAQGPEDCGVQLLPFAP
jgi:hypothetical protein